MQLRPLARSSFFQLVPARIGKVALLYLVKGILGVEVAHGSALRIDGRVILHCSFVDELLAGTQVRLAIGPHVLVEG